MLLLATLQMDAQKKLLADDKAVNDLTENAMKQFIQYNFGATFDLMQIYWPLPANEIDNLESQTIRQLNLVTDRFGNFKSYHLVSEKRIEDHVWQRTYIVKCDKHLLRILFTFYNNGDGWSVNSFTWDDKISGLFE
jgi:hypothetical protein